MKNLFPVYGVNGWGMKRPDRPLACTAPGHQGEDNPWGLYVLQKLAATGQWVSLTGVVCGDCGDTCLDDKMKTIPMEKLRLVPVETLRASNT